MKITNQIFQSYNDCTYKVLLFSLRKKGKKSDYEKLRIELRSHGRDILLRDLKRKYNPEAMLQSEIVSKKDLEQGKSLLFDVTIKLGNSSTHFDALEKVDGNSNLREFHYQPILVIDTETVSKNDKFLLAFLGFVLAQVQGVRPTYGKIFTSRNQHVRRVKLSTLYPQVELTVNDLQKILSKKQTPCQRLNQHCKACEFQNSCRNEILEKDDLSLLSTMTAKEIFKKNKRGIFTVTQLSHTFRPRRRRTKRGHLPELKALAIRENKTHVMDKPELPSSKTCLYLDAEGVPDSGMDYLLGIIIIQDRKKSFKYFWADSPSDQKKMYQDFILYINKYTDYVLYHYGSYETKLMKRMRAELGEEREKEVDNIVEKCVNVLSLIYANIYFPTYSNSLKEIGGYLGCKWSEEGNSGIQALYWCKQWENTNSNRWKEKLIAYNKRDCEALRVIVECIQSIIKNEEVQSLDNAKDLVCQSAFKIDPPTASNFDPLLLKKIFILISVFQSVTFIPCLDNIAVMS